MKTKTIKVEDKNARPSSIYETIENEIKEINEKIDKILFILRVQ